MAATAETNLTDARTLDKDNRDKVAKMLPSLRKIAGLDGPPLPALAASVLASHKQSPNGPALKSQFVEALFQQGATFLNSVLSAEASYRQLSAEQLSLRLDIEELQKLQQIHDDEVAAGLFNVPYWEAQAVVLSDQAATDSQNTLAQWVQSQADGQKKVAIWSAENSSKPLAKGWETNLADHTPKLSSGFAPTSDESNILNGTSISIGYALGAVLNYRAADYSFSFVQKQITSQIAPITGRKPMVQSKATYLQADAGFRERRRIVAYNKLAEKLAAIQAEDGPFNYADRIAALVGQAHVALGYCIYRFQLARDGIKLLYGLNLDAVPLPTAGATDPLPSRYLTSVTNWARETGLLLQKLSAYDQYTAHRVSLKALLPGGAFESGKGSGSWWFTLDDTPLKTYKFVRLRGVTAWVDGDVAMPPAFTLSAPAQTSARFGGVSNAATAFSQSVDRCRIGRSQVWKKSALPPDIAGSTVLFNASPFGKWLLAVDPGTQLNDVSDIILEFLLVIQQAP